MRATLKDTTLPPKLGTRTVFVAAALAMVACGGILAGELRVASLVVTVLAVSAIYWFGDVMDRWYHLRKAGGAVAAGDPLIYRLQLLALSLVGVVGVGFMLPQPSVMAVVAVLVLGLMDTVEIPFMRGLQPIGGGGVVRLKRVFFLKNVIVGAWWSLLLWIGAGQWHVEGLGVCAAFALVQITIGAAVGNVLVSDDARVRARQMVTPRLDVASMLRLLGMANALSAGLLVVAALRDPASMAIYMALGMVVAWRAFVLASIRRLGLRAGALRLTNLATCFLFPIACSLAQLLP